MGEINNALPVVLMKPLSEARLGNVYGDQFGTGYAGNVWDSKGICPALMCMQGGADSLMWW